jgi:heat shock protein 4
VEVKKMKKRTKRTDLKITKTGTPGMGDRQVQAAMDAESAMQAEMAEIIETDAKRNDLEGYIFNTRDKIGSSGQYGPFVTDADRDKFSSELMAAEDWLYDTPDATKTEYVEKLQQLKATGEPIAWRYNEDSLRGEWINAVLGTVTNYRAVVENPGENYSHIAPEKLAKIQLSCDELQKWLEDLQAKQALLAKTDKPVILCAEMERKNAELSKSADEILKEPKPAPPKEEKVPEKTEEPQSENKENKENEAKDNVNGNDDDLKENQKQTEGPQNMDVD